MAVRDISFPLEGQWLECTGGAGVTLVVAIVLDFIFIFIHRRRRQRHQHQANLEQATQELSSKYRRYRTATAFACPLLPV
jgi:uncharacterized membrane-anchored protein YhcB (DUF1043 family)